MKIFGLISNGWFILLILLLLALFAVSYALRRRDRRYEQKSVKETISEDMTQLIEREREENRLKKERFEAVLHEASSPKNKPETIERN